MSRFADIKVGVLAIQGDYARHQQRLDQLSVTTVPVRLAADLDRLEALFIPGGESTTLDIMLDRFALREPLIAFGRSNPVFGTCAGMIMMATTIADNLSGVKPLALIDIDVDRNGYGRQVHSFETEIDARLDNGTQTLTATFIRAPRVTRVGPGVEILARYGDDPVLLRQGHLVAASFHPELDESTALQEYFLGEVVGAGGQG